MTTEKVEHTWYQVYQTISEGTPVTPAFSNKEELIEYLVEHGDYWDQRRGHGGWDRVAAEQFVDRGYAPSMIIQINDEEAEIKIARNIYIEDEEE